MGERIKNIGYRRGKYGYDLESMGVLRGIDEECGEMGEGVDKGVE